MAMTARQGWKALTLAALAWGLGAQAFAAGIPETLKAPAVISSIESDQPFSEGAVCREIRQSMRLLTPSVVVGEPVLLEVMLTGQPVPGKFKAEFAGRIAIGRDVRIYVAPERGRPYEFELPDSNALSPSLAYELRNGETVSTVLVLAYDSLSPNGAFTYEAGRYRLQVAMECPRGTDEVIKGGFATIGDVIVEVREPEADDEVALKILGEPDDFLPIQSQHAATPEQRAKMALIMAEAPASALRPYAMAALANYWYSRGVARDGDLKHLDEAIPLYEQFLAEYPDHVLARVVRTRLVRAYSYLGRDEEAGRLFLTMWKDPYLTKILRPKEELRKWFFGEEKEEEETAVGGYWMLLQNPRDALKPDSAEMERRPDPGSMEAKLQEALRKLNSRPAAAP
ncbi:MAG: hypothetical protein PWP23_3233 [Candidatus Sumerlaeota bacterium]|nr:hypothetical protein [Candidatus Sumerlaeota bacterium]